MKHDEPSVLDWLKSILDPRRERIRIPDDRPPHESGPTVPEDQESPDPELPVGLAAAPAAASAQEPKDR